MSFEYRQTPAEQERITNLLDLIPKGLSSVLEIGTRDGYISRLLTSRFHTVTALDLERPDLEAENIICIKGDVTCLDLPDYSFDVVLCSEVLEHIPPGLVEQACREICRVARHYVVIGVPYHQDIRLGRTTCRSCGGKNPPWGHVNSFDEARLRQLFNSLTLHSTSFVGKKKEKTNPLSVFLMDLAGNPWGTYQQEELCIHCGEKLSAPIATSLLQKICAKIACSLNDIQESLVSGSPNWIHVVFKKGDTETLRT
jgi:hypothetical protein